MRETHDMIAPALLAGALRPAFGAAGRTAADDRTRRKPLA
ncbi:hypothetical protein BIWAKO_06808 [Bosea sp. BIWAKO-01]|nr:hypothetical protein BIWAKO_06808 [Bosea sp. BIWAKO-01]